MEIVTQISTIMKYKKLALIIMLVNIFMSSCNGQNKNSIPRYIIVSKEKTLKKVSQKYDVPMDSLIFLNPNMIEIELVRGDTIWIHSNLSTSIIDSLGKPKDSISNKKQKPKSFFKEIEYENKLYFICEINSHEYKIEMYNQLENKSGVYDFNLLSKMKKGLLFAMNGGMYEPDLTPQGLFINNGKVANKIRLEKEGFGNFYMQPNGVFFLDQMDNPGILKTDDFVRIEPKAKFATQSGPMLVINNVINDKFSTNSENFKVRNGVGISKSGTVVFIISEEEVSFYEFASLFKDVYFCNQALYLDGVISQYFAPAINKQIRKGAPLGPIITVSELPK